MGGNLLPRKALMETLHFGSQHVLRSQWRKRFQASVPATGITTEPCMEAGDEGQRQPEALSLLGFSGGDGATEQVEERRDFRAVG